MLGTRLGAYRIESELGSGGMGTVWLAEAEERCAVPAGTRVALKLVHPHLLTEPGFFKRFLREAEIGNAVTHPNVVRCYDCDQLVVDATAHAFLVMEYVEGQTLRGLLVELETVPEELCRHIGREVSKGLAAIHEAGVVHRDLKPENVLITPDHEVKVMDLGVARLADEAIRLSKSGVFVGSVLYAAPEQFRGKEPDGRADLFSLGVILYELACGAHPHPADDFASILAKVLEESPRRLGDRNPQVSAFFEEVVHALLAKAREGRFDSAAELLAVLEQGEKSSWWAGRAQALRNETKLPLRRTRIPRETAVHGREEELAALRSLYDRASAGDGQVILIEGEAGIGKTRLADELVGRLQQEGESFHFLFGSYPPGGAATVSGAWSTAYREQFGAEGSAAYLQETPILVPAFDALLRGEPTPGGAEPLTKNSIQTVFVHATRALARERPTVVLIEDLHFAPEEGLALFTALGLAVPGHRILLVGTARPGLPEEWRANHDRIELSRLGPKDLGGLLTDAFQSERLAEELGYRIVTKSDGNPFFVFEILRGLREGRFITRSPDGTWVAAKAIGEIEIPSSVQDLIRARIEDVSEEDQELLDVAACCGFEFDPRLVAEALELRSVPVLRRLGQMEKSHRLVRSVGRDYAFDHHQVQEAIYAGISEPLREEYHRQIGAALLARDPEPEGATAVGLCEHFLSAGWGDRARPHLEPALQHLQEGHLNDRVIALAEKALAVPGLLVGKERMEVLLRKVGCLDILGRKEEERGALDEVLTLAEETGEPLRRARALRSLGRYFTDVSRNDEAREALLAAVELAREAGDEEEEAKSTGGLGRLSWNLGRYEEAREHHEKHLALSRKIGDRRGEAQATCNLGNVCLAKGDYREAREHQERYLALSLEIADRLSEAGALGNLGIIFYHLGRYEESRVHLEQVLGRFREIGHRLGEAKTLGHLGNVISLLGHREKAVEHYERYATLSRETADRRGEAIATGSLGLVLASLGRLEGALEQYDRALALSRVTGDRRTEGAIHDILGGLYAALGDLPSASEHFRTCQALCEEIGDRRVGGYALGGLASLALRQGDRAEALRLHEEALSIHREISYSSGVAGNLVALGAILAGAGRADEARSRLEEALSLGREIDSPGIAVLASCHFALLPDGDAEEALAVFKENETSLDHTMKMEARFLLWRSTKDRAHLEEAHRLLRHLVDLAPEECREAMLSNVTLHREILRAWGEQHSAS